MVTDVERNDVEFVCRTLGCTPVPHVDSLGPEKLGLAEHVGDVVLPGSGHKVMKFVGVANPGRTMTVLLRGSNDLVLAEANRSIHDAQCVVRSLVKVHRFIAGGGGAETEASLRLQEMSMTTAGLDSHCFRAYADALKVILYTLAENAGLRPIEIVTELRKAHAEGRVGAGIDVKDGCISDMYARGVIQPLLVTTSAIKLATETVCMILKVRTGRGGIPFFPLFFRPTAYATDGTTAIFFYCRGVWLFQFVDALLRIALFTSSRCRDFPPPTGR